MGTVTYRQEMRRCGNPACQRCRIAPSHGPYWYAYYRDETGRLRSRYAGKTRPDAAQPSVAVDSTHDAEAVTPSLRIRLFGPLAVERNGEALTRQAWPRATARLLLAYLALHPNGVSRDEVCEALWPDQRDPGATLKTALSVLRNVLEPPDPATTGYRQSRRLPQRERRLRLHLLPGDWLDVQAFTATDDPSSIALSELSNLVALYTDELLPEYRYDDWTLAARETLRRRWHALSLHLAQRLVADSQTAEAISYLQAILADDGTLEEAARLLMTVLASQGRRNQALAIYQQLTAALRRDIGVTPDPVSRALAARLRRADDQAASPSPRERLQHVADRIAELSVRHTHPEATGRLARLWAEHAFALEALGQPQEALSSVQSGRLVLGMLDLPAARSHLLLAEALTLYHQGQPRRAQAAAVDAEQNALRAAERHLQGWALRLQAQCAEALGQPMEAINLARSSLALYDAINAPEESMRSRRVLAFVLWRGGHHHEAVAQHRRNLHAARALGHAEHLAYVLCGLGQTLLTLGQLDDAEPYLAEALGLAEGLEDSYLILSIHYHLANLWTERAYLVAESGGADLPAVRATCCAHFQRVIDLAQAQRSDHMYIGALNDLAVALAQWGETERAYPLIAVARQMVDHLDDHKPARGWTLLSAAEVALAGGDPETALDLATGAVPLLETSSPVGLAPAHRVIALALSQQGASERAEPHWIASLAAATRYGLAMEERRTRNDRTRSSASAADVEGHP